MNYTGFHLPLKVELKQQTGLKHYKDQLAVGSYNELCNSLTIHEDHCYFLLGFFFIIPSATAISFSPTAKPLLLKSTGGQKYKMSGLPPGAHADCLTF